ncbi:hypothetical protein NE237_031453 [Protea cynaroides]|uniref:Uncharacterized protein n=1 Tax=Protea cynaroides TaxID=273540 RepID=A0A9Q0L2G8_9MAGN|nr:hypothetical protein NE237_031453 [Protea cynaroides]
MINNNEDHQEKLTVQTRPEGPSLVLTPAAQIHDFLKRLICFSSLLLSVAIPDKIAHIGSKNITLVFRKVTAGEASLTRLKRSDASVPFVTPVGVGVAMALNHSYAGRHPYFA